MGKDRINEEIWRRGVNKMLPFDATIHVIKDEK